MFERFPFQRTAPTLVDAVIVVSYLNKVKQGLLLEAFRALA